MHRIMLLALILTGCSLDIVDPATIMEQVHSSIAYKSDTTDYWQLPDVTRSLGTGDCEDFCILFMDDLRKVSIDSLMVFTPSDSGGHVMVLCRDVLYDVSGETMMGKDELPITSTYTYEQVIGIALYDWLFKSRQ